MAREDLAGQVAGVAALADPIRRELYLYVSAQPTPISRDQASDGLGIARHTAKFHLDKLAEEGLLDISFKRLSERRGPGAGRPTKLYARSSRQLSVILPERRYDLAGHLLASAIDHAAAQGTTLADALDDVAASWGRSVADQARATAGPRPSRERLVACTCQALTENGYEAQCSGGSIVLCNCPFDALAREHTELVCGMNLAIMTAVTERLEETGLAARLEPAPERCCVVLVPADGAERQPQREESTVDDVTARHEGALPRPESTPIRPWQREPPSAIEAPQIGRPRDQEAGSLLLELCFRRV
jgi:predicted ArsR family transcriptional regulator